jgi:hypothetical protein
MKSNDEWVFAWKAEGADDQGNKSGTILLKKISPAPFYWQEKYVLAGPAKRGIKETMNTLTFAVTRFCGGLAMAAPGGPTET